VPRVCVADVLHGVAGRGRQRAIVKPIALRPAARNLASEHLVDVRFAAFRWRFLNHRSNKRTRRQTFEIIPDDTEDIEVVQTTTAMHGGSDGVSGI
jgi:hypothetical protein